MKKSIMFLSIFSGILVFSSCQKQRECVCMVGGQEQRVTLSPGSKKEQQAECDGVQGNYRIADPTINCKLD
jgi:hypothetical protein